MGKDSFEINGVVNLSANLNDFATDMETIKETYNKSVDEMNSKKVNSPLSSAETKDSVTSAYGYAMNIFGDKIDPTSSLGWGSGLQDRISLVQKEFAKIPQALQNAMGGLVTGLRNSIDTVSNSLSVATTKMNKSFNVEGFTNNIRFAAASAKTYMEDMEQINQLVKRMSPDTKDILGKNINEISSVVNPAIRKIAFARNGSLSDVDLRQIMMSGKEYNHIPELLKTYGIQTNSAEMRDILDFAIKASSSRIYRRDAAINSEYAGMKTHAAPAVVTDLVSEPYKSSLLTAGRFISDEATPRNTKAMDLRRNKEYYDSIRKEVRRGNSVAYHAAVESGLITLNGDGTYSFAQAGQVVKNKKALDQYSALVNQSASYAAQGSPNHRTSLTDPYDQSRIMNRDTVRLREAVTMISHDQRPDADPYLDPNYDKSIITAYDKKNSSIVPKLKIPEMIHIPRMSVRTVNGKPQLMIKDSKAEGGYRPNINFDWQKNGVEESPDDEAITMGRNPLLDALFALHAKEGARFEDRTYGWGRDSTGKAKGGVPLMIDMTLDDLYDKNVYGEMLFDEIEDDKGRKIRKSKFTKGGADLVRGLYSGEIQPTLQFPSIGPDGKEVMKDYKYRVIAGNLKDGGNMKMILQDDYEALMGQSPFLPMLYYFNEISDNGIRKNPKLINSKTGKAYGNTAKGLEAYTKFFDARNKMLSHSLPIEEMGVDTPLTALMNLEAFYDAEGISADDPNGPGRFDGGAFIDKSVFTRDFQARMGPAKFLAQRFDWRKWFKDSGFAYKGGEGKNDKDWHMFMPGMSATGSDYRIYKEALNKGLGLDATSITYKNEKGEDETFNFNGKTFRDWRNQKFVDVMRSDIGMLMDATAVKSGNKLSGLTADTYNKIVDEIRKPGYTAPKAMKNRTTSFLYKTDEKANFDSSLIDKNGIVSLTPDQQTELMAILSDPRNFMGLRMMKDTENYAGTKNFWSPAYMSSVQMSPKLIAQSNENYRNAFKELSTDSGIIKRMFSGKDADSIRVQNDPSLIYTDRNIQYAIQSEIQDLQEKQLQGYGYFPGTAHMMLATVNPNSVFGVYGERLTGKKLKGPAKELNVGKEGVIAPSLNGKDIYSWTRSPYAPGANFFGSRYARTAANRYGLTGESAMFNVSDFYTLNTGDFDGDFVWAYTTLEDDEDFIKMTNERNKRLAERAKARKADDNRRKAAVKGMSGENKDAKVGFNVDDFALGVLRANDTMNPTGLGYKAGQAGRMIRLTPEELAYVDDYGNKTYADAIDMLKHADIKLSDPNHESILKAIRSRKPIERLTQALYKEAHNEKYGGTNIFDYGLPTYIDQMGVGLLAGAAEGRLASPVDFGSTIADAINQNIETRYKDRTKQEESLARWYGRLLTDKLTGKYQITSTERLTEGENLVSDLEAKTRELAKSNPESQEVKDMTALAKKARKAIQTEQELGFTEGNLGDIEKYYEFMGWENPIKKYGLKTELQQSAATILIENERRKQQERIEETIASQADKAIAERAGTTVNPDRHDENRERILAANKYTGFNWSNSKHFMEHPLRAEGIRWATLEGEDKGLINQRNGELTVDFNDSAPMPSGMNVSNRSQVARSILTGEALPTRIDADALVGTAAHRYMELYGAYRTSGGVGSKQNKTIQEAKDLAYKGFRESLLGINGVLTKEQEDEQKKAGVYFEENDNGEIVAKLRDNVKNNPLYKETLDRINGKLALASRTKLDISSLDETAEKYFESAYQRTNGTSHMIMAEGVKFDDSGKQLASNSKKGNNGIWIIPQRDGEPVIKFQRLKKGSNGTIEETQAGMYFTPDMIKKDENTGRITITDWKSSEHGQKEAMFQMAFYAHQLEELGKAYHESGGKRKDLEWFGQFVSKDPFSDKYKSNIEALEAVDLYAKDKNKKVMRRRYDEAIGNYVSRMTEVGMNNLAASAALGFAAELRESIIPRTEGRKVDEGRATVAPDQSNKEFSGIGNVENVDEKLVNNIRRYEQIGGGGTGVMDAEGNFIDTDKSYLVAKFMKDEETLKNIKSFAGKQSRKINNLRFGQQDEFTQNLDELSTLFSQDQYTAIQDYLTKRTNPNFKQYTPDVKMLTKDYDKNQIEALSVMERLIELRKAYVEQLPETMQLDYDSILYGQGDAMSKLSSAQGKRERDLSALRGTYTSSQYYNSATGTFKTEAEFYNDLAPTRKKGETAKDYKARVNKAKADAHTLAQAAAQEEADFTKKANEINNAYNGFSVAWQHEFDKSLEEEFPSIGDLFKNDNLNEAVNKIRQKAQSYKQMANQKQIGGPGGFAYSADERIKLAGAYKELTQKADSFEKLRGTDFEKLVAAPKTLKEEQLQSMITGNEVSYEVKRDSELAKFAQAFLSAHPNASARTVMQNVGKVKARMDKEHSEQVAKNNESNITDSMRSAYSLTSEYTGIPISAENLAMIQARKLNEKIKSRRTELRDLIKNEKDANVRSQYQDELDALKGMDLKGAYSRYLGQTRADQNLRDYNISKSETSLNRLFGGNAPLSLQEAVDDGIANANAQIEQYIKMAGLKAGDANKVRQRYANKADLRREIEDQYNQQLEHERIDAARKQASIQERLTGRRASAFERADLAVEAMRSEIHDYRRSLLRRARRKDISDEERNRLNAEAWQYDDRNVDYEGYRQRVIRESEEENMHTRRSNAHGVRGLMDISSDRRLTAADRTGRRMEDLRNGVRDRIAKIYKDYQNGVYAGREGEYTNAMRQLWGFDYAGAESRIHTEELLNDRSFQSKQEMNAIKMRTDLENRSMTRNEATLAAQARLRRERDEYLEQQVRDKQMTEAQARAYEARYNDPYLLGIAQQQVNYEYGQRELSTQMEGRQLEATLSGRSLTRDEMIAQRRDQLEQQARAYAERLRKENRNRAANTFLRSYLPNINRIAQEEVENRLMYGEEANRNQVYAHQIQTNAALRQQQYSAEDFLRQQRNRHIRSAIFSSLQPYRERTISLSRNIQTYEDQRSIAQRELATINGKLSDSRTTQEERSKLEAQRDIKTQDISKYNEQIRAAREEMNSLSSVGAKASAIFMGFGDVLGRIATRLGRQLFYKALNEAKKFVQEFDKSMTAIQMITLKSDSQMSTLGDGLIAKAKELKISISEITQSAETLYRQGLSDEEVNERLDIISKFSKVSGTKVDAATKLITVAMNTGLVSDPQVAADIVTALGDNAATNAAQIEKGIEKAGAAAAADGTTFAQLAAMLTAITSTTQIGGNVAGRTLNTIFGRMNKVGTNELIYDENGNAVSGSAVAKLLAGQGISQYDTNGNKRSSYDVLFELSQKWDKMTDAEQQQIANAIAGTRQYSNFAAIMQGMSEGKVSEYMALTNSAEGVVDEKYNIYVKSLQASLTDLKNTFDSLISDLSNKGLITGFFEGITGAITGVNNLTKSIGGLGASLTAILPLLLSVMMFQSGNLIGGLALGATTLFGLNLAKGINVEKTDSTKINGISANEYAKQGISLRNENTVKADTLISDTKKLLSIGNRTEDENIRLKENLTTLSDLFKSLGLNIDDLSGSSEKASKALDEISKINEDNKKKNTLQELKEIRQAINTEGSSQILSSSNDVVGLATYIWGYDSKQPKNENGVNNEGYGYIWRDIQDANKLRNITYGLTQEGSRGVDVTKDFGQDSRLPLWALRQNYLNDPFGSSSDEDFSEIKDLINYFIAAGLYVENSNDTEGMVLQGILSSPNSQGLTIDDILAGKTQGQFTNERSDLFFQRTAELFKQIYSGQMNDIISGNEKEIKAEREGAVQTYSDMLRSTLSAASGSPSAEIIDALMQDFEKSILSEGFEQLPADSFFALLISKYDEFCAKIFADDGSVNEVKPLSTVMVPEEDDGKTYIYKGQSGLTRSEAFRLYHEDENAANNKNVPEIEPEFIYSFGGKDGLTAEEADDALHRASYAAYAGEGVAKQGYYDTENYQSYYSDDEDQLLENLTSRALVLMADDINNGTVGNVEPENWDKTLRAYQRKALNEGIRNGTIVRGLFVNDENQETFLRPDEVDDWVDKKAEADNWSKTGTPGVDILYGFNGNHGLTWDQAIKQQQEYKNKNVGAKPTVWYESRTATAIKNANTNLSAANQKKVNADNFIKEVSEAGITNLAELLEAVERGEIADFNNVVSDLGLGSLIDSAYSFDPMTGKITSYDEGGAIFAKIMSSATSNSQSYNGIGENAYITKAQHGRNVANYLAEYRSEGWSYNATDDELKTILGADLASRIIEARSLSGTNKISDEELAYAMTLANNYAGGIIGLTTSQRLSGIADVRKNINRLGVEGGYNRDIADQYMSQWSNWNEYAALIEARNTGNDKLFDELGGQKRLDELTQSLDNFENLTQIKLDVEGVQALEEAGKVADGTATKLEKLKKGGDIAIKVSYDIESEAYQSAQLGAKLNKGTRAEQLEAIKSLTGYSDAKIQSLGFANALSDAQTLFNAQNNLQIASLEEYYAAATTDEERALIDRIAYNSGYINRHDDRGFMLNGRYQLGANSVDRESGFTNAQQLWTSTKLVQAQQEIIDKQLTASTEGREDEFTAAAAKMGEQSIEYMRMLQANEEKAGTYTEEQITAQYNKAQAEINNLYDKALEEDALKEAELLASTSPEAAMRYARLQYNQSNKGALAANALYGAFSGLDDKTAEGVLSLLADETVKQDWEDLLKSAPELTKEFERYGHAVNEDGTINWEAIQEQEQGLDNALADLVSIIMKHSADMQNAEYDTRSDIYEKAMRFEALSAEDKLTADSGLYNSYAEVYGSDIAARVRATDYDLNDIEQWYKDTKGSNYAKGINGLTSTDRIAGARKLLDSMINGTYDINTSSDIRSDIAPAVTGFEELIEAYEKGGNTGKEFKDRLVDVKKALEAAAFSAENYGEEVDNAANSIKNLSANSKKSVQEAASLRKNFRDLQNVMTAIGDAKGKSGSSMGSQPRKILAGYMGVDPEEFKSYSEKEIESILDDIENAANKEFSEHDFTTVVQKGFNDINSALEAGTIDYELDVRPIFDIDGNVDWGMFAALLAKLNSDVASIAESYTGNIIEYLIQVMTEDLANGGKKVSVQSSTAKLGANPSGKYHKTGGGGGGGKSATDKLLEKQKQRTAEIEHRSKLLEIEEKYLDYVNNYGGQENNIDHQISAQKDLYSAYAQNLSELQAQLATVKQGSDDYNKLADAIRSTEEAMASVKNTINDLNHKKISILQTQQENLDKPANHQLAMLQKYAQRYQKSNQFESYVAIMEKTIETSRDQIAANNRQITEWEALLGEYYENSDSWIEVRDKIWALREENAELENQIAADTIDLQEAKIAQIAKDLQDNNLKFEHANNMFDTFGEIYQATNNQEGYRSVLADTNKNNEQMKALTDQAIDEIQKQINSMKKTDPARQTAIQTLYELEEASARYEASILQNRNAIEESFINQLTQAHGDSTSVFTHEMKLLQEAEKGFLRDDDFVNYENIVKEEARNASDRLEEQQAALQDYLDLQNSGKITEGSQAWRELEETIRSTKEDIATLTNEYEELMDKLQTVKFENTQQNFNELDELAQHNLKMIQFEETRYQNNGQLTNYGTLLAQDTEMQRERAKSIADYIEEIKKQQAEVEDNPELYKKMSQEIYKWEESLSQVNNTIEKNVELLKKNEEAIRKVRQAVENTIDKEIRARIQKQRDMLSATVQIENSVLDVIKKRYTDEWNLLKTDLNKKKQALNDEKSLINERLNARKEAIQKEEKYEELAELERQYALISADPTRTKEAKELRKKIQDLQKDISWDIATAEANAQTEAIDDQIKAIDSYVSTYEEDLNEMLSDANNFRDEMDQVMGGSFEEFVNWMKENNEAYKKSTTEARQQMEWGWEDTWKKMKDELDTYWNEVNETMRSREGFIQYMMGSDAYRTASDSGRESLVAYWGDMYDDYTASLIDDATFEHTHEIISKIDELKDWVFGVRLIGTEDYDIQSKYSQYDAYRDHSVIEYTPDSDYAGYGKTPEPEPTTTTSSEPTSSGSGSGTGTSKGHQYAANVVLATSSGYQMSFTGSSTKSKQDALDNAYANARAYSPAYQYHIDSNAWQVYKKGGLVDYTGPAWVDGTKSEPEAFLSANDTALLRGMLDAFNYVRVNVHTPAFEEMNHGRPNVSIGDVHVSLNVDRLERDADYEEIANKVGKVFTKQLQKEGLNLAGYSW